jgi:hypothetical protein
MKKNTINIFLKDINDITVGGVYGYMNINVTICKRESLGEPIETTPIVGEFSFFSEIYSFELENDSTVGLASVDISDIINTTLFNKYYVNYTKEFALGLRVEVLTKETNIEEVTYLSSSETYLSDFKVIKDELSKELVFSFEPVFLGSQTLSTTSDSKIVDFKEIRAQYLKAEYEYERAKKQYELSLVNNSVVLFAPNGYEPKSPNQIITRCLEFQEGTILPALDYYKRTEKTIEYRFINEINENIKYISGMYQNITLDDGEGIPYQRI